MTTIRRSAFVSIAATMTLVLGACASTSTHPVLDGQLSTRTLPLNIRFDNLERESVDVYLISPKREWRLGRVAPGAIATLRLPDDAFAEDAMMVRLAVLAGAPLTFAAARNPRSVLTVAQPASTMLSQEWTFSRGALTSVWR